MFSCFDHTTHLCLAAITTIFCTIHLNKVFTCWYQTNHNFQQYVEPTICTKYTEYAPNSDTINPRFWLKLDVKINEKDACVQQNYFLD